MYHINSHLFFSISLGVLSTIVVQYLVLYASYYKIYKRFKKKTHNYNNNFSFYNDYQYYIFSYKYVVMPIMKLMIALSALYMVSSNFEMYMFLIFYLFLGSLLFYSYEEFLRYMKEDKEIDKSNQHDWDEKISEQLSLHLEHRYSFTKMTRHINTIYSLFFNHSRTEYLRTRMLYCHFLMCNHSKIDKQDWTKLSNRMKSKKKISTILKDKTGLHVTTDREKEDYSFEQEILDDNMFMNPAKGILDAIHQS